MAWLASTWLFFSFVFLVFLMPYHIIIPSLLLSLFSHSLLFGVLNSVIRSRLLVIRLAQSFRKKIAGSYLPALFSISHVNASLERGAMVLFLMLVATVAAKSL
jgi:hypothetical protein